MLNLKMKNEKDKADYYHELNRLNQELRDKRLNMAGRSRITELHTVQSETATILKKRLTKLIVNNKEKVRLIDNYQRNMKVIDEAFNTIKEATGLTDIEEIQNIFIKG
jgi:2-succinyl-5-enolpyruvyl-6-hydroxy-3-cyclohexene-1-carboxylate synthase